MKVFVMLSLVALAAAAPSVMDNKVASADSWMDVTTKMIASCADSNDKITCYALKGVNAINRAARAQNLEVLPGVSFIRDPEAAVARNGKSLSETDVAAEGSLIDATIEAASNFMSTHNLEVQFPKELTEAGRSSDDELRFTKLPKLKLKGKKVKKILGPIVMAIGAKLIALVPLFLGGLVLLATKALVVAKIAFVLAASLAAQKFLGGKEGGFNLLSKFTGAASGNSNTQGWASTGNTAGWSSGAATTQGWSTGGAASAQYPYARSWDAAQEAAYSAQVPVAAAATTQ